MGFTGIKRLAGKIDGLAHVSVKPAGEIKVAAGKFGKAAHSFKESIGEYQEKRREHKREQEDFKAINKHRKLLEGYERDKRRRDIAEDFVYGRPLTKRERRDIERYGREQERKKLQEQARKKSKPIGNLAFIVGDSKRSGQTSHRKPDYSLGGNNVLDLGGSKKRKKKGGLFY